jgi:hypothetical protein
MNTEEFYIQEKPAQQALSYIINRMDLRDKYALAVEAATLHTTTSSLASINFIEEPGEELEAARKLLNSLSDKAKLIFAIELLSSDLGDEYDEDEDELWGPEEDPSITQAIAQVNANS